MSIENLSGGRSGIRRLGCNKVIRPRTPFTPQIHEFLNMMHEKGADYVPQPYDLDAHQEVISFLPGRVANELPAEGGDNLLISAATLLARFHLDGRDFLPISSRYSWLLPTESPLEVMCHGDFAPYNVTINQQEATGIIDFDTLHPGCRLSDVAYAVYRWVPFHATTNQTTQKEQLRRTRLFLNSYQQNLFTFEEVRGGMMKRLSQLIIFMETAAANGDAVFQKHIASGHVKNYLADIEYVRNFDGDFE